MSSRSNCWKSDGKTYSCSPASNARLFQATIGGMGLTGIILSASLRLMRVPSLDVVGDGDAVLRARGIFRPRRGG